MGMHIAFSWPPALRRTWKSTIKTWTASKSQKIHTFTFLMVVCYRICTSNHNHMEIPHVYHTYTIDASWCTHIAQVGALEQSRISSCGEQHQGWGSKFLAKRSCRAELWEAAAHWSPNSRGTCKASQYVLPGRRGMCRKLDWFDVCNTNDN